MTGAQIASCIDLLKGPFRVDTNNRYALCGYVINHCNFKRKDTNTEAEGLGYLVWFTPAWGSKATLYGRPPEDRYYRSTHCGNICICGWWKLVDVPFLRRNGGHCDLGKRLINRHQLSQFWPYDAHSSQDPNRFFRRALIWSDQKIASFFFLQ